jgi:DNA-binding NtrC family response regulator
VRELENAIERAVLLSEKKHLDTSDFSWILDASDPRELSTISAPTPYSAPLAIQLSDLGSDDLAAGYFKVPLTISLRELEEQYIQAYCRSHPKLSREEVASGLGINRKTLYRKFQERRELKEGTA